MVTRKPKDPDRRKGRVGKAAADEPAMVRAFIVATLGLLGTFGVSWATELDKDQVATLVVIATVVVPIVQGLWTRFKVTPSANVLTRVSPATGQVLTGEAAALPTDTPVEVYEAHGAAAVAAPVAVSEQHSPDLTV